MAYNLALTIKATGTNIPVCIVHDKAAIAHLDNDDLKMFDHRIESTWDWNKIRFNIDQITPYNHNFQMDADMLWLYRDPEELFSKYADQELLVTNEGYKNVDTGEVNLTGSYIWLSDFDEAVKKYGMKGKVYQMRWESLLFKKTENVRKMMKKAESIRKNPKLTISLFEQQPVDEFCFYVACNLVGLEQIQSPFIPAFWCRKGQNPPPGQLSRDGYYAVGFGGNSVPYRYKEMYDILMINATNKLGLPYKFQLQSKRSHLTLRR